MYQRFKKLITSMTVAMMVCLTFSLPAYAAANTNISEGIVTAFGTYMKPQIKDITNKAIIPAICGAVLIILIVKSVMSYGSYRRNGQFEWHVLAVLGGCLVIGVTSPLWMWGLIGW